MSSLTTKRRWTQSRQQYVLSVLSHHKHLFVVQGKVVGPSNPVYSSISRRLGNKMSPAAVYGYIKQNKAALAKYEEWGVVVVKDDGKENEYSKRSVERLRRDDLEDKDCESFQGNENAEEVLSTESNGDSSLALRVHYLRSSKMSKNDDEFGMSILKELRLDDEMKFMENFDPEKSKREQRKLNRKISNASKRSTVYDDKGIHIKTGLDLCDCLDDECEGCFFACPKCRSLKCGHECRQNRRWMYESYQVQGTEEIINNQYTDH